MKNKKSEWKRWFSWHPVFVDKKLVWLKWVERKWCGSNYNLKGYHVTGYQYRRKHVSIYDLSSGVVRDFVKIV